MLLLLLAAVKRRTTDIWVAEERKESGGGHSWISNRSGCMFDSAVGAHLSKIVASE
jgi:hypothetical protein